jgi:hypothetical protein
MRFTVSIKLRPIRIAFFVKANDRESLLRAISINSFLWGGYLNPIIPLYKRPPKQWKEKSLHTPSIKSISQGYVDAFDPDFITAIGAESKDLPDLGNRKFIDASEILNDLTALGGPRYGIGYFELLCHFGYEELRFVRREPIHIVLPRIVDGFKPFLASAVGQLPSEVEEKTRRQILEFYKSSELDCDIGNFWKFFRKPFITPRRLSSQLLKQDDFSSKWDRNYVFYLDASNLSDVIDY